MSFVLRILFSGLIAFVPSDDGTEITVLLLRDHAFVVSDGTILEHHNPLLLARGGGCSGQCPTYDPGASQALFSDRAENEANDSLAIATAGGGVWRLSDVDLTIRGAGLPKLTIQRNLREREAGKPSMIPTTSREREDFSWVADLGLLCPRCKLRNAVLAAQPPRELIAARVTVRAGRIYTYSVLKIDGMAKPINFAPLAGDGTSPVYTQEVATWVAVDIPVQGESVDVVERQYGAAGRERTMTLSPRNGLVEVAVLNLPQFVPPPQPLTGDPSPGKHFELYYELAETPPAKKDRPVPQATAGPQRDWLPLHQGVSSELLKKIRIPFWNGAYDRVICPMAQF